MSKSKKETEAIESAMGVFVSIISGLVELVKKLGGSMENIYQLAKPEGREKLEEIARLIVNKTEKARKQILRLISGDEIITINECDGSKFLAKATDVFGFIDSDLKNWSTDKPGKATGKTPSQVYEMVEDAIFIKIFGSLSSDVKALCLTQHQIVDFVINNRKWLQTGGYATFFLFEKNNEFFVASVLVHSDDRLYVDVYRLEHPFIWLAEYRPRVVVPQIAA